LVDKNGGSDYEASLLKEWKRQHEEWVQENLNRSGTSGTGGEGGGGTILGDRGVVIGGRGGRGGVGGNGGKGGSGFIQGNDGVIIGGDGGSAGTSDGRGGRSARGPTEKFGFSSQLWGFGRGGSGGNHPEYNRRLELLRAIRAEYKTRFPDDAAYIEAGIERVPVDWINQRLVEFGEAWSVSAGECGYVLPSLASSNGDA